MRWQFWKKITMSKNPGQAGEEEAIKYLKKKGYKILKVNFCNPRGKRLGEIDIIAEKNKQLVFVEVKTRLFEELEEKDGFLPEENITPAKLRKMSKIARFYLHAENFWDRPHRFDAISVKISRDLKRVEIKHLKSIFF